MMENPGHKEANKRNTARIILIFVLLTFVAIVGQTWITSAQDRRETIASEQKNSLVAIRLLEEHATQTLEDANRNLDGVIDSLLTAAPGGGLNEALVRSVIKESNDNRYLQALQFITPDGHAFVTSNKYPAFQTDADDRTYIPYMLKHPEIRTAILGHPFKRFYDGELVLPMARNLVDSSGRYLGIVNTDISVKYLSDVYTTVSNNSQALVSLITADGYVIVRAPFEERYVSADISKARVLEEMRKTGKESHFEDDSFINEYQPQDRYYTYGKISGFPAYVVFAHTMEDVLKSWHARTQERVLYGSLFIIIHLILTYILMLHIGRLRKVEDSLRDNVAQLKLSEISLQESKARFISMFEKSPVPLALIRLKDNVFTEANHALLMQFGYTHEEFVGKTPLEIDIWVHYEERGPYLEQLSREQHVDRYEVLFRCKDGTPLTCLLSAQVFEADGQKQAVFSPIDITAQREVEHKIRDLNTHLEERVRERTYKLERSNHDLAETLDALKSMQAELIRSEKMAALGSLVAGVAHELNTPIGNSVMFASTLRDHVVNNLNDIRDGQVRRSDLMRSLEASAHGAELLLRSLDRAANLVSSFKQVAIDQSSNHRRSFALSQTLEEVLATISPMYKKLPYKLERHLDADVDMDSYPGAIGQVLTNLVSNSILHGFEGRSQGTMRLSTRTVGADLVELLFNDDGCGIPEKNQERVFDPFFTTKLGHGSSGLGMHLVYNLVTNLLGGKISIVSSVSSGTLVSILLPLRAPDNSPPAHAANEIVGSTEILPNSGRTLH